MDPTRAARRTPAGAERGSGPARPSAGTPRPVSRWDRDSQRQRWLIIGIALLLGLVVAIFAGGLILDNLVRPSRTVAMVHGEAITARELLSEIQPAANYIESQGEREILLGAPARTVTQQVEFQKRALPDQVLNEMIDVEIVRQEAERRGITVGDEEVEERIRETIAQIEAVSQPQPTPQPSPEGAVAPTPDLVSTPTPVPTLGPEAQQEALERQLSLFDLTETRYRELIRREVLIDNLQEAITADVGTTQEQVHARHVLTETEEEAQAALERLQQGEAFEDVAREVSEDPGSREQGGDLGWFPRGMMHPPFEEAAFALEPGQRSGVVQSPSGYHIIEVLERDANRALQPEEVEQLKQTAFQQWLRDQRTSAEIQITLQAGEREWLLRNIGVRP